MISAVEELKPCPYVSMEKNDDVSFILEKYQGYYDFVLFKNGIVDRCFRFTIIPPAQEERKCIC